MEKQGLFQIGDAARLFHLSVSILRHYERIGLVKPEYTDPETGYRYYSVRQFERLNTIRYLRALDTPLESISDFFQNRNIERIQEILCAQKEAVINKQRELAAVERKIDNRLRQLRDASSSELDVIKTAEIPPCRAVQISGRLTVKSYLDMEIPIRKLEREQKDALVFLGKVGLGISREHLLCRELDSYDTIFLLLDGDDNYDGEVYEIPQEKCVSIRFCGSHEQARPRYEKLLNFIDSGGMKISGNSYEITMIDYGFTNDESKFVTEIRIPIDD